MPTIAQQLNKLNQLRQNLASNLVVKGVEAAETETLNTLVPKVLSIRGEGAVIGDLRENLEAVGATVPADASGNDLVDWVLHIFDNDVGSAGGTFVASMEEEWDTPLDVFTQDETWTPADVINITSAVRIKSIMVRLVGKGVTTLTHTAPGWVRTDVPNPDGELTFIYTSPTNDDDGFVVYDGEEVYFHFTPSNGGIMSKHKIYDALNALVLGGGDECFAQGRCYIYATRYDDTLFMADGYAQFIYTNVQLWGTSNESMKADQNLSRDATWEDAALYTWGEIRVLAIPRNDIESDLLPYERIGQGVVGLDSAPYGDAIIAT